MSLQISMFGAFGLKVFLAILCIVVCYAGVVFKKPIIDKNLDLHEEKVSEENPSLSTMREDMNLNAPDAVAVNQHEIEPRKSLNNLDPDNGLISQNVGNQIKLMDASTVVYVSSVRKRSLPEVEVSDKLNFSSAINTSSTKIDSMKDLNNGTEISPLKVDSNKDISENVTFVETLESSNENKNSLSVSGDISEDTSIAHVSTLKSTNVTTENVSPDVVAFQNEISNSNMNDSGTRIESQLSVENETSEISNQQPLELNEEISPSEEKLNETDKTNENESDSQGILSMVSSEVLKNAAMAMEIFNLTDLSLTDHIIEDHVFMDPHTEVPAENVSTHSKLTESVEGISSTTVGSNELILNASNLSLSDDTSNFIAEEKQLNNTEIFESVAKNEMGLNETVSEPNARKCPSPGICLFWFVSRDTCSTDDQCIGTKLCCRVRCSKVCVQVDD